MIEVKGLNKSFGEHHVLKNIDAQFHKGQVNIYYWPKWLWENCSYQVYGWFTRSRFWND